MLRVKRSEVTPSQISDCISWCMPLLCIAMLDYKCWTVVEPIYGQHVLLVIMQASASLHQWNLKRFSSPDTVR